MRIVYLAFRAGLVAGALLASPFETRASANPPRLRALPTTRALVVRARTAVRSQGLQKQRPIARAIAASTSDRPWMRVRGLRALAFRLPRGFAETDLALRTELGAQAAREIAQLASNAPAALQADLYLRAAEQAVRVDPHRQRDEHEELRTELIAQAYVARVAANQDANPIARTLLQTTRESHRLSVRDAFVTAGEIRLRRGELAAAAREFQSAAITAMESAGSREVRTETASRLLQRAHAVASSTGDSRLAEEMVRTGWQLGLRGSLPQPTARSFPGRRRDR